MADSVKAGSVSGCKACANKEKTIHGMSGTRIHHIWQGILQRCNNPKAEIYQHYGAKGITVCKEWQEDFQVFYKWANENGYTKLLSIDRKDVTGNYEPSNCRWETPLVQSQNQNTVRKTNTSGYKGVSFKAGKYEASISDNSKRVYLGRFAEAIDAAKAYDQYVLDNSTQHTTNGVL